MDEQNRSDHATNVTEVEGIDTSQYYVVRKGEYHDMQDEIEELRAMCNDLHHDATCPESFCRLCGEGIREWEARRG